MLTSIAITACASEDSDVTIQQQLANIEAASGGRLGVWAFDTKTHMKIAYRATERFPFCSTFKVMVVAAILKHSMSAPDFPQKRIFYTQQEVEAFEFTPISKDHVRDGMTVKEIAAASMMYSDNAVNLLIDFLGGPQKITAFARKLGDPMFRLDRMEPALNASIPNDPRDTSTPEAMGKDLQTLILGDVLGESQREQLITWLKNNTTGNARIRAGVPKDWVVGDKTGTSLAYGTTNDIAVIWPSYGSPIIMTVYFTNNKKDAVPQDALIASVARVISEEWSCV